MHTLFMKRLINKVDVCFSNTTASSWMKEQSSKESLLNLPSLAARRGDWSVWDGVLYDSDELPAINKRK